MPKIISTPELTAPGHVYQPRLGSGIEWLPETARLWKQGTVWREAQHQTSTPYEFWHKLAFATCFPEISHWWFRSAWTQKVRLTRALGMADSETVWGYIQFIDPQQPAQIWTVTQGERPTIETPYPPQENQPINLPLRLALARLVAAVLCDDIVPNQWVVVTSLVSQTELSETFQTDALGYAYRLPGIETDLRSALCRLQGLGRPSEMAL